MKIVIPVLDKFSKTKKFRAIHCAETKQSYFISKQLTKKTEPKRCILLKPDFSSSHEHMLQKMI